MQFLNNNGFRTAVIVFIIFLAIPFLFTDKQPTALTPQQEVSGGLPVGMTKNPLAKFFNRVASFYGLKNKAGQGIDSLNSYADAGSAAQNLGGLGDDSPVTIEEASSGAPKGFVATDGGAQGADVQASAGEVVQEYVRMDGKTYEVVKDPSGKKYVLTDNGPVSFDELMASTVSKEEFEAAKKIAPSLSDDEIPYAIRSPYGVKGYLDRKMQGLLTYEDNPSLFGGPDGNLRGQRGSNLFGGPSGHSMFGGNEEAFDEAKSGLASKYARAKKDAASSIAASSGISYSNRVEGMVDGKYAQPVLDKFASLITNEPIVEKVIKAEIKKEETAEQEQTSMWKKKGSENKADAKDTKEKPVILSQNDNGVIIDNPELRAQMTAKLLGGKTFEGKYDNQKPNEKPIPDPWILPAKVTTNAPGMQFYNSNYAMLNESNFKMQKWGEADDVFNNSKSGIMKARAELGKINMLVINGKKNGAIELLPQETYYHQLIGEGLLKGVPSIATEKGIDSTKINAVNTIIYAPEPTASQLTKHGYHVVVLDPVVTPDSIATIGSKTLATLQEMKIAKAKQDEDLKKKALAALGNKKGK